MTPPFPDTVQDLSFLHILCLFFTFHFLLFFFLSFLMLYFVYISFLNNDKKIKKKIVTSIFQDGQ